MAVDYFLKIEGIDGESSDSKHKGEIAIESFSWGEAQAGGGGAGGGGSGKVQMQDFHFEMKTQKSSPKLFLACATGEHLKQALLTARKAGSQPLEFLKIKLSDVLVSSFQLGGGGDHPMEQLSLSFAKIEWEYREQAGTPVKAGFDLKKNKKV